MKIIIDEDISYAHEIFSCLGEVKTIPGRSILKSKLYNVDALVVRSVTKVNKELLSGTSIKFVGTTTAGIDHVDSMWLINHNIKFVSAPGCNAISVVEYIFSALLSLAERDNFSLQDRIIGIIGVGNIGGLLQKRFAALGIRTLLCDPPRADRGDEGNFLPITKLVEHADILTFHTPLYREGPYKTFHLANEILINRLKPGSILINTCRGQVVDNAALLKILEAGKNLSVVLDVWEKEPEINVNLLKKVDIGTAHIAGSTLEGKTRGTLQVFEAYSSFINKPQQKKINMLLPKPNFSRIILHGSLNESILKRLVHLIYDVRYDDRLLRKSVAVSNEFDQLRKNYLNRREWSSLQVICENEETALLLNKLGFNATYPFSY